jgi:hypothetical protein
MPTLFDKQGQPVEIPQADVPRALASGEFGLSKQEKYLLRDPKNKKTFEFSGDAAVDAIKGGWRLEAPEETRSRQVDEEFGDSNAAALAAGAARGLTFGASDLAMTELGIADPETLSGLREANPALSATGEIGAIGLSLLAPGGQARALGLLRATGAAPRAVAKLGRAVEQSVGASIGGTAGRGVLGRAVGRAAEVGAGSAVEGALFGAGQAVTEAALGDEDLTAESLLAHAGMGAALGGTFGAALGSGFELASAGLRASGRVTKKVAESTVGMWERQTGNKALPGLTDLYAGTAEAVTGAEAGAVGKLLRSKEARRIATLPDSVRDDAARAMAGEEQVMIDAFEEVSELAKGRLKKEFFRSIVSKGNQQQAQATAIGLVDGLGSKLDEMLAAPGEFEFRGLMNKLRKTVDSTRDRIEKSARAADGTGRIFGDLDELKRTIGTLRSKMARARQPRPADLETADRFERFYEALREPLENAGLFGKRAADAQKKINASWVRYLKDIKRRPDHRFVQRWEGEEWTRKAAARPDGFRSFIDDLGSTKDDLDIPWLAQQQDTRQGVMDAISEVYTLKPKQLAKVRRAKDALRRFRGAQADAEKTVGLQNQLRELEQATGRTGLGSVVGGVGGFLVGGAPGAVAGAALGAVVNPAQTVRQLATLDRLSRGVAGRVKTAVDGYVKTATKGAKKTIRGSARAARKLGPPAMVITSDDKKKTRGERYRARLRDLTEVLTNPQLTTDRLDSSTRAVDVVAPVLAGKIQAKTMEAARYLADKAPRSPAIPSPLMRDKWEPSATELAKFERYARAVDNPLTVIEDMKNGTLTPEAVDALEAVYPKLYEGIRLALMARVEELQDSLPYDRRIQLGMLFDAPLDPTLQPQFVMGMQAAQDFARPQTQQQGGGGRKRTAAKKPPSAQTAKAREMTRQETMTTAQQIELQA